MAQVGCTALHCTALQVLETVREATPGECEARMLCNLISIGASRANSHVIAMPSHAMPFHAMPCHVIISSGSYNDLPPALFWPH